MGDEKTTLAGGGMDKEKVGQTVKLMNTEGVLWKSSTVETS